MNLEGSGDRSPLIQSAETLQRKQSVEPGKPKAAEQLDNQTLKTLEELKPARKNWSQRFSISRESGIGRRFVDALYARFPALKPVKRSMPDVIQSPPSTVQEKARLNIDAQLAAFPYHQSMNRVHGAANSELTNERFSELANWAIDKELAAGLVHDSVKLDKKTGLIHDKKSGLTAYVFRNDATKEIRLVFGGTTSGRKAGGMNMRSLLNRRFTLNQWLANAKNVLGKRPDSYLQAKTLTNSLVTAMKADSKLEGFRLVLSGHSKGGGEASYAALARDEPLKAVCFSSAELGPALKKDISDKNRQRAHEFVTHTRIAGDAVPKVGKLLNGSGEDLSHLGAQVTLPGRGINPIARHDKFAEQVAYFANHKQK